MKHNIILTIGLLLFMSNIAFGQKASIYGVVTTSDGQALEYVNVGIVGLAKGTITERNGGFEISNINPGKYTVFASFIGAERQEQTIQLSAGERLALKFSLQESASDLAEVIVTDIGTNRLYADSVFTVAKLPLTDLENPQVYNSISSRLLKEQVVTNMNDALKNATGVSRLWQSTGRGGDGAEYYSMRGFSVQPTMVNGMPSLNNGGLDPANIERVDVIKGPSGTLFGSSVISYGGLINITTKRPMDSFKGELGWVTGSYGLNRLTADINSPLNELSAVRVNMAYQNSNTFQDAGSNESFFIAPSFKFKASEKLSFLINTEFLKTNSVNAPMLFLNRSNPITFSEIDLFENNYERSFTGNELGMNNTSYGLQAQALYTITNDWTSQTVVSRSSTKTDGYYHYLFDNSDGDSFTRYISDRNGQTLTTDIQQNFIGNIDIGSIQNNLVIGLDYYHSSLINGSTGWVGNGVVTLSDGDDTGVLTQAGVDDLLKNSFEGNSTGNTRIMSAYISDVAELHPTLSIMASIRVDNFKSETGNWSAEGAESQTALSPKFGIVYKPLQDKVSVFANYMNGFVNVAPRSVADADGSNQRLKTFSPENANQVEFGVKTKLYQDKVAATASYYHIDVKNRLMTDPNNVNNSIQGGQVKSQGVELSVIASPVEGLDLVAGYSKNHAEVTQDYEESGYLGLRPEEAGPDQLINFWASYSFQSGDLKGFGLGFGGNAASEYLTINRANIGSFALPAYQVFNASINYSGSQYFVALKVNNLTDQKYYTGWSTVTPQNPRNVSFSLNYRF